MFKRGPNYRKMDKWFKHINYSVINLLSIGGWNIPHINTNFTIEDYFQEWLNFNEKITNIDYDFYGFNGVDWVIEGYDDMKSNINHLHIKN